MWTWIKNKQPEARENVSDQAASFLKKSQRKSKQSRIAYDFSN